MIHTLTIMAGGPSLQIEGFYLLDFIVFVSLLVFFVRKPIASFTKARRDQILADMDEAKKMREEAEARLKDYEARLANLEGEVEKILADAKAAGEEERNRILVEATRSAERIRKDAEERLEQEGRKLSAELRVRVVEMALGASEALVKQKISAADQRRFVTDYVSDLEKMQGGAA